MELQAVRSEVAMLANAINMLCARVDEIAAADHQTAMQTEMGAIANVVGKLSERVDKLEPKDKDQLPASPLRPSPTRPPMRQRAVAEHTPEVKGEASSTEGGHDDRGPAHMMRQ